MDCDGDLAAAVFKFFFFLICVSHAKQISVPPFNAGWGSNPFPSFRGRRHFYSFRSFGFVQWWKKNFILPTTTSHHVFCLVLIVSNPLLLSSISLICPRGQERKLKEKEGGAIEPRSTGLRRTRRDRSRPAQGFSNGTSPHFLVVDLTTRGKGSKKRPKPTLAHQSSPRLCRCCTRFFFALSWDFCWFRVGGGAGLCRIYIRDSLQLLRQFSFPKLLDVPLNFPY